MCGDGCVQRQPRMGLVTRLRAWDSSLPSTPPSPPPYQQLCLCLPRPFVRLPPSPFLPPARCPLVRCPSRAYSSTRAHAHHPPPLCRPSSFNNRTRTRASSLKPTSCTSSSSAPTQTWRGSPSDPSRTCRAVPHPCRAPPPVCLPAPPCEAMPCAMPCAHSASQHPPVVLRASSSIAGVCLPICPCCPAWGRAHTHPRRRRV